MKTCLVSDEYPPDPGGVGVSVRRIACGLLSRGIEAHIAVLTSKVLPTPVAHTEDGGIPVTWFGIPSGLPIGKPGERAAERYVRFSRWVDGVGFDVFHSFFPSTTGLLTGVIAKERCRPFVASFRGNDLHHVASGKALEQVSWVIRSAAHVTFPNSAMLAWAGVAFGRVGQASVLRNGVEAADSAILRVPLENGDSVILGTAGTLRSKKGIHTVLAAARLLATRHNMKLVLVGDFPPDERDHWLAQVGAQGLQGATELTGFLSHAETLRRIATLDVFVHAAIHDGCPNALLEAAAAARPIVCSRITAHSEILRDGAECIGFDVEHPEELAEGVARLIADPRMARALGAAARRRVTLDHSIEQETDSLLRLYRDCAA